MRGTIITYNNVKDLKGSFKAYRVHFLVIHAAIHSSYNMSQYKFTKTIDTILKFNKKNNLCHTI